VSHRILIKGACGAGKSTLALVLARNLGVPCIELDALHHGPNWTAASAEELRAKLSRLLDDQHGWVVDGNYDSKLGTLVTDRAHLTVWLDLPLPTKLWRLAHRTARRWLQSEELWNGNRETLRGLFWGRDALLPWSVRTHFQHRREWPTQLAGQPLARLRSPTEVDAWLAAFCASPNE
jgi:adenylate kinase family enzyme